MTFQYEEPPLLVKETPLIIVAPVFLSVLAVAKLLIVYRLSLFPEREDNAPAKSSSILRELVPRLHTEKMQFPLS